MGRPACDLQDFLEWQGRIERYESSDLDLNLFCLQEGVSRSSFYRWKCRLEKEGLPESVTDAQAGEPDSLHQDAFLPISIQAPRIEIELPNGGIVRLPADLNQFALVSIIKVAGALRPWKPPQS